MPNATLRAVEASWGNSNHDHTDGVPLLEPGPSCVETEE